MSPKSVKLYYFDGRGRAEPIRWLLALAGWKYEDVRVRQEDYPALKPKTPWGSLPYMEVDGMTLCQSLPMASYIAMEAGLMGSTKILAALCEMVAANTADAFNAYGAALLEIDEEEKKSRMEKLKTEMLPKLFKYVMNLKGKNQYIIGNKLSLADVAIAVFLDNFDDAGRAEVKKNFPDIITLYHTVVALPRIASWIKQRPKTSF